MKFTTTTSVLACSVSAVVAGKGKKDKYDDYDDYGKKEGRSKDIHPTAKPTSQPVRRSGALLLSFLALQSGNL